MTKIVVNADDGDVKLRIEAKIVSAKGLVEDETEDIAKHLGRGIADVLRSLHYSDFGPENTTISIV